MSKRFLKVQVMQPLRSNDDDTAWKEYCLIVPMRSGFYIMDNLSIAANAFARHVFTSLLAYDLLLLKYVNWSSNLKNMLLKVEMSPSLNPIDSVSFEFPKWPMRSALVLDYATEFGLCRWICEKLYIIYGIRVCQFLRDIVCFLFVFF